MGNQTDEFTSKILKILISKNQKLKKSQNNILIGIKNRLALYKKKQSEMKNAKVFDFVDQPQYKNYNKNYNKHKDVHSKKIITINDYSACSKPGISKILFNGYYPAENPKQVIRNNIQNLDNLVSNYQFQKKRNLNRKIIINDAPYPRFEEGRPFFTILSDTINQFNQTTSIMIDGVPLMKQCQGSIYKQGEIYDFYIINLSMDDHPLHIHLVNFQIIGRFMFDHQRYKRDWEDVNGLLKPGGIDGIPQQIDVRPYRISDIQPPLQQQKLFLDVIKVPNHKVTIARIKFSNHQGKPFPFDISGAKFVYHCHILQHEDNQMMRYFCIQ